MSDPKDTSKAEGPAAQGGGSAATEISFCPHLGIYRYKRADGVDYMFDTAQLEATIESYIKVGKAMDAEFMALLTGLARRAPHQVVVFDESGKCRLQPLAEQKLYDAPTDVPAKE
jgi:hypothetical protein